MAERLSVRAYAQHRKDLGLPGGSPAAVRKARDAGRITVGADGLIDPAKADQEWGSNTRSATPVGGGNPGVGTPHRSSHPREPGDTAPAALPEVMELNDARAAKESYLAHLRRLEYEEKAGSLVSVDYLEEQLAACLEATRRVLLNIPGKLAPRLVGVGGIAEAQAVLQQGIDEAMEALRNVGDNPELDDNDGPESQESVAA